MTTQAEYQAAFDRQAAIARTLYKKWERTDLDVDFDVSMEATMKALEAKQELDWFLSEKEDTGQ